MKEIKKKIMELNGGLLFAGCFGSMIAGILLFYSLICFIVDLGR